jgi:hypothetical protein
LFQGEFEFDLFLLFFAFFMVCRFFCYLLVCFSLAFGLLVVLYVSWIQNSNFVPFLVSVLIRGEIEKPTCQYLGLIVMSH